MSADVLMLYNAQDITIQWKSPSVSYHFDNVYKTNCHFSRWPMKFLNFNFVKVYLANAFPFIFQPMAYSMLIANPVKQVLLKKKNIWNLQYDSSHPYWRYVFLIYTEWTSIMLQSIRRIATDKAQNSCKLEKTPNRFVTFIYI